MSQIGGSNATRLAACAQCEFSLGSQTYTVQPGDNLSKISKRFYGDPNKYPQIVKANNLENPDKIKVGQQLLIPAA